MIPGLPLDILLAASPTLAEKLPGVRRAAEAEAPVLILGEPGTGRSALARALHIASRRAAGPLVEMDPGSGPSDLFESDLFGYQAGAFTGATRPHAGRLERARGGSLLLDHVEGLPLSLQPKLLRLLSEGRYSPLGGRERVADVRFLAISDESLGDRVEKKLFRQDLFYRLEVLAFRIPPLRSRRSDIPFLVDHFLGDLRDRFGLPALRLSERALGWMQATHWPGNLRQLRNLLEREVILRPHTVLDPPPPEADEEAVPRTLAAMEVAEIRRALAYTRGHQGRAAELLGISRKALWQKRRRHGIP